MSNSESRSMNFQERDFLLHRILCGFTSVKSKGRLFKVKCPTLEINYRASEIYLRALERSKGMMKEDQYPFIGRFWSEEKEQELEKIPEGIKTLQKELYKSIIFPSKVRDIRIELSRVRDKQRKLFEEKSLYSSYTAEGYASYAKSIFVINKIVFYRNKPYNFQWHSLTESNIFMQQAFIDADLIRELARSTPWSNTYGAAKVNGPIFPVSGVELTQSQQILLMWTKTYDDIYQSPDCPHESIIDDDDMLDGWLLIQKEERDKDKKERSSDKLSQNEKINNSQEVFVLAKTKEDANAIYGLNNPKSRNIIKNRLDTVQKRGEVREQDLPDVQQRLIIEAGQSYHNTLKGNK